MTDEKEKIFIIPEYLSTNPINKTHFISLRVDIIVPFGSYLDMVGMYGKEKLTVKDLEALIKAMKK